jgi:hypothetical protein
MSTKVLPSPQDESLEAAGLWRLRHRHRLCSNNRLSRLGSALEPIRMKRRLKERERFLDQFHDHLLVAGL